jgi:hypothetical protein
MHMRPASSMGMMHPLGSPAKAGGLSVFDQQQQQYQQGHGMISQPHHSLIQLQPHQHQVHHGLPLHGLHSGQLVVMQDQVQVPQHLESLGPPVASSSLASSLSSASDVAAHRRVPIAVSLTTTTTVASAGAASSSGAAAAAGAASNDGSLPPKRVADHFDVSTQHPFLKPRSPPLTRSLTRAHACSSIDQSHVHSHSTFLHFTHRMTT